MSVRKPFLRLRHALGVYVAHGYNFSPERRCVAGVVLTLAATADEADLNRLIRSNGRRDRPDADAPGQYSGRASDAHGFQKLAA